MSSNPPKTLSHSVFVICAQEAYAIIPDSRLGTEPEGQRGGGCGQDYTAGPWTGPNKSEPLQPAVCRFLLPLASRVIKPCTAQLYITLKLGLRRGILAFSNEAVALSNW